MGKFVGKVNTDMYALQLPEMKACLLEYTVAEAGALDADGILNDQAIDTTDPTVVTTFLAQPPTARGLTFTPSASADAGNIVVVGTNIDGDEITDTIATSTTNAVSSAKIFKTVTSVSLPKDDGGITWDVGWDCRIGLPFMLPHKPIFLEWFNGGMIFTAGTGGFDVDEIEKNYIDPHSTLDGAKELKILLFV